MKMPICRERQKKRCKANREEKKDGISMVNVVELTVGGSLYESSGHNETLARCTANCKSEASKSARFGGRDIIRKMWFNRMQRERGRRKARKVRGWSDVLIESRGRSLCDTDLGAPG